MKKYFIFAAILIIMVAASGCSMQGTGSGNLINQSKSVNGVNQVYLAGMGTIILQQGNQESLTVEAEDNIIPHIQTTVNGKTLNISYDTNTPIPTKEVKFYLTVKDLNSVSLAGNGILQSTGFNAKDLTININGAGETNMTNLNADKLILLMGGAGKATMAGKVNEQSITINGAGDYDSPNLESKIATVNINGGARVILQALQSLNVVINGGGEVAYIGNPQVVKQINGAGTVKQVSS